MAAITDHADPTPLLRVEDLRLSVRSGGAFHPVVRGLSFDVHAGETLAIVGESGCGKSLTALAIMGLLPPRAVRVDGGRIGFDGQDLLRLPEAALCGLRGNRMAMIFQEPMTSLNPVLTIGFQIAETVRLHRGVSADQAWKLATSEPLDLDRYGVLADRQEETWRQVRLLGMIVGYLDEGAKRGDLTLIARAAGMLKPTHEKLSAALGLR